MSLVSNVRNKVSSAIFGRNKGNFLDFGISEAISGFGNKNSNKQNYQEQQSNWEVEDQNRFLGEVLPEASSVGTSLQDKVQKFSSGGGSSSGKSSSQIAEEERRKAQKASILSNWDDFGDQIKNAKGYVNKLGNNDITTVANRYRLASDDRKRREEEAVEGNRTLIDKNQRKDLSSLAGQTMREMNNTNNMLGVLGASRGSASQLANKALGEQAGQKRADILTGYGDQQSEQTQSLAQARESYKLSQDYINNWEKEQKKVAMDELNDALKDLEDLKKKGGKWRDEDVKSEGTQRFQQAIQRINEITNRALSFREQIISSAQQMGMSADELEAGNIDITTPAELKTPEFNPNIDFATEAQGEDYYNPNKTGERKVLLDKNGQPVKDAFGNVVYEDELVA